MTQTTTLGDRLFELRGRRSRKEFAAELGVHEQSLVRYENNARQPADNFIRRVAELEGVSPDWLLTGRGEKSDTAVSLLDLQQPDFIGDGEKKVIPGIKNGGVEELQLGFAASRPAAATGEAAPGPAAAPLPGNAAVSAAAPDLAAQLVVALRENAALLRELGDLRVREVEQRVELERLRAELASARARCALLEERERENGSG